MHCASATPSLDPPAICSQLFQFNGNCGVPKYHFPGWSDVAFYKGAWEHKPIRIRIAAANVTITTNWWRTIWAQMFVGDSFNADPVTPYEAKVGGKSDWTGRTRLTLSSEQRLNVGMQLPAKGQFPAEQTHLDVHLQCEPENAFYFGSLSVWYKVEDGSLP